MFLPLIDISSLEDSSLEEFDVLHQGAIVDLRNVSETIVAIRQTEKLEVALEAYDLIIGEAEDNLLTFLEGIIEVGLEASEEDEGEESRKGKLSRLFDRVTKSIKSAYRKVTKALNLLFVRLSKAKAVMSESAAYARIIKEDRHTVRLMIRDDADVYYTSGRMGVRTTVSKHKAFLEKMSDSLEAFDGFLREEVISIDGTKKFIDDLPIVGSMMGNFKVTTTDGVLGTEDRVTLERVPQFLEIEPDNITDLSADLTKHISRLMKRLNDKKDDLPDFERKLNARKDPIKNWESISLLMDAREFIELSLFKIVVVHSTTLVRNLAAGFNRVVVKEGIVDRAVKAERIRI